MENKSTNSNGTTISRPLRLFFGIGEFGQSFSVITLNLYLLYFYTDIMGISAAAAGTLMLVARIWDAFNDPIMGLLIDRTTSRHGKCRPYLLYCAVPAGLFLFLTFFAPALSNTAKLVWAYGTYIGQGMLYTATGISYTTLIARITDDPLDRVKLNQSRAFIAIFASVFISSMTLKLVQIAGGGNERKGFAITAGVYGVLQALSYLGVFYLTRGYDAEEKAIVEDSSGKTDYVAEIRLSLKSLMKNTLWRWLALATLLYYSSAALTQGILVYYVKYYLKRPDLIGIATLFSMVSAFIAIVLLQLFVKKLGKSGSVILGLSIAIGCILVRLVTRDTIIPIYLGALLFTGFGLGLFTSLFIPILMDSIDYGEWKNGVRNDALVMSANSFGNKLGSGVGAAGVAFMLQFMGYIPGLENQPETVANGLFNTAIFVPLVIFSCVLLIMLVYRKYENKMPEIRKELAIIRPEKIVK